MSNPKTITIDDVQYVRADSQPKPGPLTLVVLPRGFIYVGKLDKSGDWWTLRNASNVRKWSSGGFGGLTLGAKSSGAALDKCSDLAFAEEAVVSIHPLAEGWADA